MTEQVFTKQKFIDSYKLSQRPEATKLITEHYVGEDNDNPINNVIGTLALMSSPEFDDKNFELAHKKFLTYLPEIANLLIIDDGASEMCLQIENAAREILTNKAIESGASQIEFVTKLSQPGGGKQTSASIMKKTAAIPELQDNSVAKLVQNETTIELLTGTGGIWKDSEGIYEMYKEFNVKFADSVQGGGMAPDSLTNALVYLWHAQQLVQGDYKDKKVILETDLWPRTPGQIKSKNDLVNDWSERGINVSSRDYYLSLVGPEVTDYISPDDWVSERTATAIDGFISDLERYRDDCDLALPNGDDLIGHEDFIKYLKSIDPQDKIHSYLIQESIGAVERCMIRLRHSSDPRKDDYDPNIFVKRIYTFYKGLKPFLQVDGLNVIPVGIDASNPEDAIRLTTRFVNSIYPDHTEADRLEFAQHMALVYFSKIRRVQGMEELSVGEAKMRVDIANAKFVESPGFKMPETSLILAVEDPLNAYVEFGRFAIHDVINVLGVDLNRNPLSLFKYIRQSSELAARASEGYILLTDLTEEGIRLYASKTQKSKSGVQQLVRVVSRLSN